MEGCHLNPVLRLFGVGCVEKKQQKSFIAKNKGPSIIST